MSEEGEPTVRMEQTAAEVDRIRDIIFGTQMRSYEHQFKRIVAQLDQIGKELEELRAALQQQRSDQEASSREVRLELLQRLDQQGNESRAQATQLAADLRKQGQDLRRELTTNLEALDEDKASRQQVGDLLVEVGTRLKEQKGLADLLGQLVEKPGRKPKE